MTDTSTVGDLQMVADLIEDYPKAAARLAALAAANASMATELEAVRFELDWLLRHAREVPAWADRGEEGAIERVRPTPDGKSYVLVACPRLEALMSGAIPSLRDGRYHP